ncbi:hypothetical protein VPH35_078831 [Triticum aestivum]
MRPPLLFVCPTLRLECVQTIFSSHLHTCATPPPRIPNSTASGPPAAEASSPPPRNSSAPFHRAGVEPRSVPADSFFWSG